MTAPAAAHPRHTDPFAQPPPPPPYRARAATPTPSEPAPLPVFDAVIHGFLRSYGPLIEIANEHNIDFESLCKLLSSDSASQVFSYLRRLANLRVELVSAEVRLDALRKLRQTMLESSDDSARKAAIALLRATTPPRPIIVRTPAPAPAAPPPAPEPQHEPRNTTVPLLVALHEQCSGARAATSHAHNSTPHTPAETSIHNFLDSIEQLGPFTPLTPLSQLAELTYTQPNDRDPPRNSAHQPARDSAHELAHESAHEPERDSAHDSARESEREPEPPPASPKHPAPQPPAPAPTTIARDPNPAARATPTPPRAISPDNPAPAQPAHAPPSTPSSPETQHPSPLAIAHQPPPTHRARDRPL